LTIRPSERVKVIPTKDGKLIRAASGVLDTYQHLCEVRYRLWRISGNQIVSETEEAHQMRYFFPQEIALFFRQAGLAVADICSFDEPFRPPSESTWNILVTGIRDEL
jgi:hypothetical protein